MNASELRAYLGRRGLWTPPLRGSVIAIAVRIKESQFSYGRIRLLIEPVSGEGQAWVEASTVEVDGIETPAKVLRPDRQGKTIGHP